MRGESIGLASFVALLILNQTFGAVPAMKLIKRPSAEASLLRNGSFEHTDPPTPLDWNPAPGGGLLASGQGRNASRGLHCINTNASDWSGASQTLLLNRTNAFPFIVKGWSKAREISGSPDSGYSLYVDIIYQDGTPLWAQTANFRTGTHDWQPRELMILPEKPVKSLTLHCILRGHLGEAWFDDVSLEEMAAGSEGPIVFQGLPVEPPQTEPRSSQPSKNDAGRMELLTRDGLLVKLAAGGVHSLKIDRTELAGNAPSGFLAQDVAAGSDIYGFSSLQGECPDLGLSLQTKFKAETNHIVVEGRLKDTAGKDRAVTLFFSLPIDASDWQWGEDIRRERFIEGRKEFGNMVVVGCGATGTISLYPLAAIHNKKQGVAIGLDMAQPAQYRLCYHAGTRQLFIAWDFGLAGETAPFASSADFRFVIFRFDPDWGFRAAFQKFMEIFPEHFRVRSQEQGIWMPFTDVGSVQQWEDFGFKYHEGNNRIGWDNEHRVLSFRYTEPMTWWMPMPKNTPRTTAEAVRTREELAVKGEASAKRMANVARISTMCDDAAGQPALSFRDTPWCNGAVWSLNPNPHLPVEESGGAPFNAATVYWNPSVKERLYGKQAREKQAGEYLDSLEGYVTTDLNFCRSHFRSSTVPLTFAADTKEPAIYKGLAVFEFTKWLGEEVHVLDKLMFANGVPNRFSYLCPWLDILGTETDWLNNGQYSPPSDSQMSLWRTMAGAKPYLLLMNTDYEIFTPELVEKYFQRSLFYGMFPSMFSHNAADNPYWQNPKWYNRDRALFKKYIPIIKQVAEAGWEPVTFATLNNPAIYVERFGPNARANVYLTFFNDSAREQSAKLDLDFKKLHLKAKTKTRNLLTGMGTTAEKMGTITLQAQEAMVFEFLRE